MKASLHAELVSAAAMAFLVAAPELGVDAVLLSFPLLGLPLTIARIVCATIVAIGVGVIVGGMMGKSTPSAPPQSTEELPKGTIRTRLREAFPTLALSKPSITPARGL